MKIEEALSGGDPRSLGRADEIAGLVLNDRARVRELFDCMFSDDEVVRMRGSDALEKVCRRRPELLAPFTQRLLVEVPQIQQPSVQWHLAQILSQLSLDGRDRRRAIAILERNLARYDDWVLVNLTLEALAEFARDSVALRRRLIARLSDYTESPRKSVSARARRILAELRGD